MTRLQGSIYNSKRFKIHIIGDPEKSIRRQTKIYTNLIKINETTDLKSSTNPKYDGRKKKITPSTSRSSCSKPAIKIQSSEKVREHKDTLKVSTQKTQYWLLIQNHISQVTLEQKYCKTQPSTWNSISLKTAGKEKTVSDKQKLRESITNKSSLQEMLKQVLKPEGRDACVAQLVKLRS